LLVIPHALQHFPTPLYQCLRPQPHLHSFPTRRSSDLPCVAIAKPRCYEPLLAGIRLVANGPRGQRNVQPSYPAGSVCLQASERRSEEHTSELQSRENLVCRLLLEKKNTYPTTSQNNSA